ncbi:MAG: hypothetical protein AAF631_12810, partial [Pseudomonadota bacterium]
MALSGQTAGILAGLAIGIAGGVGLAALNPILPRQDTTRVAQVPAAAPLAPTRPSAAPDIAAISPSVPPTPDLPGATAPGAAQTAADAAQAAPDLPAAGPPPARLTARIAQPEPVIPGSAGGILQTSRGAAPVAKAPKTPATNSTAPGAAPILSPANQNLALRLPSLESAPRPAAPRLPTDRAVPTSPMPQIGQTD